MKSRNFFLIFSIFGASLFLFSPNIYAEGSDVIPPLAAAVNGSPFYWSEGGLGINILKNYGLPIDVYLTSGVSEDSTNKEIIDAYYAANPDLESELIVPNDDRVSRYVVTFVDGEFEKGLTVTSFSKFSPNDVFDNSPEFVLESLPSKDKQEFYEYVNDWKTRGLSIDKFSTIIYLVSPDNTIIQTWKYNNCEITDYVILRQENKVVISFNNTFSPEIREQTSFSCDGFSFLTEQKTLEHDLKDFIPRSSDSAQAIVVKFHDGIVSEPTIFTTFSKFTHLSYAEMSLPFGDISIPIQGGVFEGRLQFELESLPSKDKEKLYQFVNDWLTQSTTPEPIDVDVELITGDGTIIQTWAYADCSILDYQIFSEDSLIIFMFTGKLPTEIRDKSHFECNGLEIITEQLPSSLQDSAPIHSLSLVPDEDSSAQFYLVKFSGGYITEPKTFTTFSKFTHLSPTIENTEQPFTSKENPQFAIESLPSSDKGDFYQIINDWLIQETELNPFDVDIEIITGDGTVLQTYEYADCSIIQYAPYLDDNFLSYKFTGQFKIEIRDTTTFDCSGYNINPEQRDSEIINQAPITPMNFLIEDDKRAQSFIVTFSSGNFKDGKTYTTFSKFSPDDVFVGKSPEFILESLTSKDKKLFYDEINHWRTQDTPPLEFEVMLDMVSGDGTQLQRWHYNDCEITDFESYIVDDILRMKHTFGMKPELRDKTFFRCNGFELDVRQQPFVMSDSISTVNPVELVPSKEDRAMAFFVTASNGMIAKPISSYEVAKFTHYDQNKGNIPVAGSTFTGTKDLLVSGLPTTNQGNLYDGIEEWMALKGAVDPVDFDVTVLSGDGTTLQNFSYADCDIDAYVAYLYHNILVLPYSFEEGSEIRENVSFDCVGFDMIFDQIPMDIELNAEVSNTSPLQQQKLGVDPRNIQCKDGKTLMIKPSEKSVGCFNESSVSKMEQRNWTLITQSSPVKETISKVDFVPSKADRAKSFNVKFIDGGFGSGKEFSTFSNFYPFGDLTILGIQIPENKFGEKPQFALESLPSKDKQFFYNEVGKWRDKSSPIDPFDTVIDIISENGTIIQTWKYNDCDIFGYEINYDENLLLVKYHDQWNPEIVDKTKFSCNGLHFFGG